MTDRELGQERDGEAVERKRRQFGSSEFWAEWERRWKEFDRADQEYLEARERLLRLARRR
jgi:hypothetical protein